MTQEPMSNEEFGRVADELYDTRIRPLVETEDNLGKLLVLDVETGDYEIEQSDTSFEARKRMRAKYPGERLAGFRIGYDAVHAFGGYRPMPSKR